MSTRFDSLLARAQTGEFTNGLHDQSEEPIPEQNRDWFDTQDILLAAPRGVVGAAKSTYGLLDTLTFDALPDWESNPLGESTSVVGGLLEGVAQFATGFVALGGVVGAAGKAFQGARFLLNAEKGLSLSGRVAQGALTDFTVFDGQSGRLADLVAQVPGLKDPMERYMSFALTDAEDGELLGRIKNTLEGAGVGAAVDGILKGIRWMREINKAKGAGKSVEEAVEQANSVVPLQELNTSASDISDIGLERPLDVTDFAEGVSTVQADPTQSVLLNADGSASPGAPENFVPLAAASPEVSERAIKNILAKHSSLRDNPNIAVRLSGSGTEIGVIASESQKLPLSGIQSENLSPKELADRVKEALREESPSRGVVTKLPVDRAAAKFSIFRQAGYSTKDVDAIARGVGLEFSQQLDERGKILFKVNKAKNFAGPENIGEGGQNVGLSPNEILNFPLRVTDAVNPRDLSTTELLAMGLVRKSPNLSGMRGTADGAASAIRAVDSMFRAAWESDLPKLSNESRASMRARIASQTAQMFGMTDREQLLTHVLRQGKATVESVDRASSFAMALNTVAASVATSIQTTAADLLSRAQIGKGIDNAEWADFAENIALLGDLTGTFVGIKNALGRGLYAQRLDIKQLKIPARLTTEALQDPNQAAQVLLSAGGIDSLKKTAEKLKALGTTGDMHAIAATLKLAQGSLLSRVTAATQDFWLGALLSSIRTQITNINSTAMTSGFGPIERIIGANVGLMHTADATERAAFKAQSAHAMAIYSSMFATLGESFQAAKLAFRGVDNVLNPNGPVMDLARRSDRRALSSFALGLEKESVGGKAIDGVGAAMGLPMRALRGSDEFFKNLNYRAYVRAKYITDAIGQGASPDAAVKIAERRLDQMIYKGQAFSVDQIRRRALERAQSRGLTGIRGIEYAERKVSEAINNPGFAELSALSKDALAYADEMTFTTPIDPNSFAGTISSMVHKHPMTKFMVPFVRTPWNLILFGAQRTDIPSAVRWLTQTRLLGKPGSAFAGTRSRFLMDMMSSDPTRRAAAIGRITVGSTFLVGASALVMSGAITGRGPTDPDERKAMMDAGWLPYAIKIGDTYVSYARMDPMASVLGTVADMSLASEYAPLDKQQDLGEVGLGILAALANNLTNKSYLQGLSNFFELLSQPQRSAGSFTKNMVASFVPNAVRDLSNLAEDLQISDPAMKEIRDTLDAVMAKIPGLSGSLDPRRNAIGEKFGRIQSIGANPFTNLVVPYSASKISDDPVLTELANRSYGFSSPPSTRNGYDMADFKNSQGQSAYDRWMELSSQVKVGGRTLRESLKRLFASESYKKLSPFDTSDIVSPRTTAINSLISRYRRAAFTKALSEFPEMDARERAFILSRQLVNSGRGVQKF